MWNWIKRLFGFGKKAEGVRTSSLSAKCTSDGRYVNRKEYYKKGNSFYRTDDDSMVEDMILLVVLMEMFDGEFDETDVTESVADVEVEIVEALSVDEIDVAVEIARQDEVSTPAPEPSYSAPEPSYSAPEPSYSAPEPSYSAPEPSYSGGSSYDSGSSDSGGGD